MDDQVVAVPEKVSSCWAQSDLIQKYGNDQAKDDIVPGLRNTSADFTKKKIKHRTG